MKVLRFRKHWKVELTDEPEPQPAPGEVIVEVDAVGICGSDVHGFAGITDRRKPGVVMGHEIGGRIVAGPGSGPERLVSAVVPLEEAAARLETLAYGKDRSLRVQVSPSGRCLADNR